MKNYTEKEISKKCKCEWAGICPHCSYKPDMNVFECNGCKFTNCNQCEFNKELKICEK